MERERPQHDTTSISNHEGERHKRVCKKTFALPPLTATRVLAKRLPAPRRPLVLLCVALPAATYAAPYPYSPRGDQFV